MSYDLYVFRTPTNRDPQEIFDEEMTIEEGGGETNDDADLDRCQGEVEEALGDAASCYRCGGHISINIPYHHGGTDAPLLFGRLAACLQRACTLHGFTVYDPQEGRAIDPQRDLQSMLAGNNRGTRIVQQIQQGHFPSSASEKDKGKLKKAWWRFW